MLPSSSSHLARYGQINHYKKFWLLQTQLEKQEQQASTATALSLGVAGGTANIVKESKPLISSNTHGDHLISNTNNIASHGSCRGDMVSSSSSRAGAFPYCCNDSANALKLYHGRLGYYQISNGSLRGGDSTAALSLAVNCERVAHPINFLKQTWAAPTYACPASGLQFRNTPSATPTSTDIPAQVNGSSVADECDSSECSNDRGDKRGLVVWDNVSTSQSTSSFSLSSKQQHEFTCFQGHDPSSIKIKDAAVLLPPSRSGHGCSVSLRTCTLCGTTKTPLWRSGPEGPKSLCNACGIRTKKTKRLQAAMEAAGEGAQGIVSSASSPAVAYKRLLAAAAPSSKTVGRIGTTHKRKLSMDAAENQKDPVFQLKKKKKDAGSRRRSRWPPPKVAGLDSGTCYRIFGEASANLGAGSVIDSTSKKCSSLFAKDVEEAAVLLMALSCGLVLS